MTDRNLSPQAQAVMDAAADIYWNWSDMSPASSSTIAAAAIRAVADRLVPETEGPRNQLEYELGDWDARDDVRNKLLAIADELEGSN